MAINKYVDDTGLNVLVREIKRSTAKVYKVKGKAIYADTNYLNLPTDANVVSGGTLHKNYRPAAIDSYGLWKLVDQQWTKLGTEDTPLEVGWVFNIENTFVTDSDFVEGQGTTIDAGSNICIAEISADPVAYKWDILGNTIDMALFQTKNLVAPITTFENETTVLYANSTLLPSQEAKATATITENMVAIMSEGAEAGTVYRAHVSENQADPALNDIIWVELGNQLTVEGALKLLAKVCPNTPVTEAEIMAMFNE